MFVNNEITNRGLLHKVLAKAAREVTMEERLVWARSIDKTAKDAARSHVPTRNRVARPAIVIAAMPALSVVATTLRDGGVEVSREAVDAVRAFMTDGIDSPLYGRDSLAARRGADDLRRRFVAGTSATRTREAAPRPTAA
jgi:nicotinic acid mononucleotide adenylyltransferase